MSETNVARALQVRDRSLVWMRKHGRVQDCGDTVGTSTITHVADISPYSLRLRTPFSDLSQAPKFAGWGNVEHVSRLINHPLPYTLKIWDMRKKNGVPFMQALLHLEWDEGRGFVLENYYPDRWNVEFLSLLWRDEPGVPRQSSAENLGIR